VQSIENNVEKLEIELKKWINQQTFSSLNETMKEMQMYIKNLQKTIDDDKIKDNEMWKDIFLLKNMCNEIHQKCMELPQVLARAKDMREMTLFTQDQIQHNNSNQTILSEWLKHQMSLTPTPS